MAQPLPPPKKSDDLQAILQGLLPTGSKAYFQPGPNVTLVFPCIVFKRDYAVTNFANNSPYRHTKRWEVKVIDRDPESDILAKVAALPSCRFVRHYTAEGLHHDVHQLYF